LHEKEDTDACLCLEQQHCRTDTGEHCTSASRNDQRLLAHKLASCDATGIGEYIRW
jgi:hypothetical protein